MEAFDIEIKEKKVGKNKYLVHALPPFEALALLGDLQSLVTSNLSMDKDEDKEFLKRDAATILAGIGKALKGRVLVEYAERLLDENYVSVQPYGEKEPSMLDDDMKARLFTGHMAEMLQVMMFVLEVNFKDFFEQLMPTIGSVTKTVKK